MYDPFLKCFLIKTYYNNIFKKLYFIFNTNTSKLLKNNHKKQEFDVFSDKNNLKSFLKNINYYNIKLTLKLYLMVEI
jgi:hypothetical protein